MRKRGGSPRGTPLPSRCTPPAERPSSSPQGLAKAGVERGDLPKEIEGSCGCGENCRTQSSRRRPGTGVRPIDPSKTSPAESESPDSAHPNRLPRSGTVIPWERPTVTRARRSSSRGRSSGPTGRRRGCTSTSTRTGSVPHARHLREGSPSLPRRPRGGIPGKKVRVRGEVTLYKDRPEMVVRDPGNITVVP